MAFKKNDAEVSTEENKYTGCDEELSQELTDEEYEQMLDGDVQEEEVEEVGFTFSEFFAELKEQAVCKLLFLFAAIGFIFPFFSEYEETYVTATKTGLDLFKPFSFIVSNEEIGRSWFLIAAFIFIAVGFILVVDLKKELRNIVGFVCATASAVCMGIFAYTLPSLYEQSLFNTLKQLSQMFGVDLTDKNIRLQNGINIENMGTVLETGFWFVLCILVVLAIYFVAQIVKDSKKRATDEMTLTEGEFTEDFDEDIYDEEVAAEIEAALEEAAQETEEKTEE